ncbi:MAG: FAD:protein FMN transferase [Clostridia bacterium]|nr:FAD:protein FMN transferase [Clostridia bacterium]
MKLIRNMGLVFLALWLVPWLVSCSTPEQVYADSVFTGMDTAITLRLAKEGVDNAVLGNAAAEAENIVAELEGILSCHDETSELYALNQNVHLLIDADETLLSVLDTALNISELTDGAYDPTIGALTELWNVANGGPVPKEEAVAEALLHLGTDKLSIDGTSVSKTDPAMQIDLGGVGKGYALQEVLSYLASTEIPYGLVSMGGNIGVFGEKPDGEPYQIGIRDPHDTGTIAGYLYIPSGFVSVSGDYERYFRQDGVVYHHILDPETGRPADTGLSSVAVYTMNGASADALSTALFVLGLEESMALYESGDVQFEAVFITKDNRIVVTPGLTDRFELTSKNYTMSSAE